MDVFYCVRCKKKTPTLGVNESVTKNNRSILKGLCSTCGSKKNKFVSKSGGDIVSVADSALKKIGLKLPELHLRTLKGKKFSYCGPGTDLINRLNPDDTPKDWSKPINKVDEVCLQHDLAYRDADLGKGTRSQADKKMLNDLNDLKHLNFDEKVARALIKPIIYAKDKLGLGIKKKFRKPKNSTNQ